jgi:predicted TIM-barrel fold metal-dependent hydrolase
MTTDRRVDVHHHYYPAAYLEAIRGGGHGADGGLFPGVTNWSTARTIEEMDRHGVTTAILSLSPPGCNMGDRNFNRDLARLCADHAAGMIQENPGRFGFFAPMPMPDIEGTLAAIGYALDVLKADGIALMTSYNDRWLGDPLFDPVMEELNRRKALVYVHPLAADCCANLIDWVPAALLEYPNDTSRAIMGLMFGGTLSRLPDIRFIFCHGGGTIPFLSGRIKHSGSNRPFLNRVPKGIDYELRKLHYDIALAAFRPALLSLLDYIPMEQILLGSDYPFSSIGTSIEGLAEMELSAEQLQVIYAGNAERLMPRLSRLAERK